MDNPPHSALRTRRTKGCLWIGLGVAIVAVMVGIAVVAGAGFWLYQNFAPVSEQADQAAADRTFDDILARFKGQQPLIDLEDESGDTGRATIRKDVPRPATGHAPLEGLHVAVYDPDTDKLVRFSIPFWLLRLSPDGKLSVGDDALRDVAGADRLTVAELEALGPGLLIDERKPNGHRVLVWTE